MTISKIAAGLAVLAALSAAQPAPAQEPNHPSRPAATVSGDRVRYKDLAGPGGPQLGTVWGDAAKGPHGSFLWLPHGFISAPHLHTGDYDAVIVAGTVTNAEPGQAEVKLGPGSYYFQRREADHVTKCLGDADCLIYISQSQAFDFVTSRE